MELKNFKSVDEIISGFDQQDYVLGIELATVVYLMMNLGKPILVEGNTGVGKTEIAPVLSKMMNTELIRLQCYEGLDVNSSVYEWNYQKQLLSIKIQEQSEKSTEEKEKYIFGREFLLERPLLKSITAENIAPVLLIDEIDRADLEFEAFLLELLSEFQISIPEIGTIKATHKPLVVLTSNRTRELSDALRRRCLYHWIDYPNLEKEIEIVAKKIPGIESLLLNKLVSFVHKLRSMKLNKPPGVAETLDWANGLLVLGKKALDKQAVNDTLSCLLKSENDRQLVLSQDLDNLISKSS